MQIVPRNTAVQNSPKHYFHFFLGSGLVPSLDPRCKGATTGAREPGPPKVWTDHPNFFDEENDCRYITDCSARNWVGLYHPYFVLYNNIDQGIGPPNLKTWSRPCPGGRGYPSPHLPFAQTKPSTSAPASPGLPHRSTPTVIPHVIILRERVSDPHGAHEYQSGQPWSVSVRQDTCRLTNVTETATGSC